MNCLHCGQNIPDGASVCPFCNESTGIHRPAGSSISMSSSSDRPGYSIKRMSARFVAKLALLAAIICFAFPFVTISCGTSDYINTFNGTNEDYNYEFTYKGYNFIFPSTVDEDNGKVTGDLNHSVELDGSSDVSKEESNKWLAAVVICCAVGCILLFIKLSDWLSAVSAVLSFAGIICLSRFKSGFAERYLEREVNGVPISIESFVDVDYRYGYSLCMLFLIIAAIACTITFLTDKFRYDKNF